MVPKAVILATEPAASLPVANRPLAAHALDSLARAGVRQAAVVLGEERPPGLDLQAARAVPDAIDVAWLDHDGEAGLWATLCRLEDFIGGDPFVLHLADSLSRSSVHLLLNAPAGELDCTVLVQQLPLDDAVVELAHRRLTSVAGQEAGTAAGIWVFGPGALKEACRIAPSGSFEVDAIRTTHRLVELGGRVDVRQVAGWWRFTQSPEALLEGNRFALEGLRPEPVQAHLIATRIQGAVSVHRTARLESSVVRGPAIIGPGARLRDTYIGPYTAIGADVVVEGAEIEHSIVLPAASICHLGSRLEASVIGPRARVFRDFRLPKALRLNIGEGAEISLA
jgi:glucose-1-phosphate thymidylyltransferase